MAPFHGVLTDGPGCHETASEVNSTRWDESRDRDRRLTRVAVTDQALLSEVVIVACFVAKNELASKQLCGRVETYEFFYTRLMTQQKNLM